MLGIGSDGCFKAHGLDHRCDIVIVDQLGVAEHLGTLAKELENLLVMGFDLSHKLLGVIE